MSTNKGAPASPPTSKVGKPPVAAPHVLASLVQPVLILDVRDQAEVAAGKGGPPARVPGSHNVPLNHDGRPQRERETTADEFAAKLAEAGVELPGPHDAPIITHCGSGGRGGRAQRLLMEMGYTNVHNGGGPSHISAALGR